MRTGAGRHVLALLLAAAAAAVMVWGAGGLPAIGQYNGVYGNLIVTVAPVQRQTQNVVSAINFDYRGLDTLGEEFILFTATAGTSLLLRRLLDEAEHDSDDGGNAPGRPGAGPSDALRAWGIATIGAALLFGLYMVAHGTVSPGGGFQGGCILASAWLIVFVAGDMPLLKRVTSMPLATLAEAIGAGAYAAIGLGTLLAGGAFLQNLLPLGMAGEPTSGGTIGLINAAVGLEVTGGFVLILHDFLRQVTELRGHGEAG